jgi:hypothetical protein
MPDRASCPFSISRRSRSADAPGASRADRLLGPQRCGTARRARGTQFPREPTPTPRSISSPEKRRCNRRQDRDITPGWFSIVPRGTSRRRPQGPQPRDSVVGVERPRVQDQMTVNLVIGSLTH